MESFGANESPPLSPLPIPHHRSKPLSSEPLVRLSSFPAWNNTELNLKDLRILNPISPINFQKISEFSQNIDIFSDSIWAKLTSVETFWRHDVSVPQQAASEMGVGLPQPACRSRLQTTVTCTKGVRLAYGHASVALRSAS